MSEKDLNRMLVRAQSGDETAFAALFYRYKNLAYNTALRITKDSNLSEDIVQDSFIEAFSTIGKLENPDAFGAWLKTIVHHQCSRYYRKKEIIHETQADILEDGTTLFDTIQEKTVAFLPDVAWDQKELRATITGMLDSLPDAQSAALIMFYYDGLSLQQIAQAQGVPINTANTRLSRGRIAMRKSVEAYEKKHNVRLHSVALAPFMVWLLQGTEGALSQAATVKILRGVSGATGIKLSTVGMAATETALASVGTVATTNGAATATGAGFFAKLLSMPIAAKVAAGALAISLTVGVPLVIVRNQDSNVDRIDDRPEEISIKDELFKMGGADETSDLYEEQMNPAEYFDAFDGVEVVVEGVDGDGYAKIEVMTDDPIVQACEYSLNNGMGLENGDEIRVYVSNTGDIIDKYGVRPKEYYRDFKVETLPDYLMDPNLLSKEMLREIATQYIEREREENKERSNSVFTYGEVTYYKTFFGVGRENCITAEVSALQIFVCCDVYHYGEYWTTHYTPIIFYNVLLEVDGSVRLDIEKGSTALFTDSEEGACHFLENEYVLQEIDIEYK